MLQCTVPDLFTSPVPLALIFTHRFVTSNSIHYPGDCSKVFPFGSEQRGGAWIRRGKGRLHRSLSLTTADLSPTSIIDWNSNTETGDYGLGWKLHFQRNHLERSKEIHKAQEQTMAGSLNLQFMKRGTIKEQWTCARKMRSNSIGHFISLKHIWASLLGK